MSFELLFQGPINNAPETLVKLRGVFVADLELPIEQVRHILESAPVVIRTSDSEDELQLILKKLRLAGAEVLIVKKSDAATTEASPEPADNPVEIVKNEGEDESVSIEIDFDDLQRSLDRDEDATDLTSTSADNVHYLDLTDSDDLAAVQAELDLKESVTAEPNTSEIDLSNRSAVTAKADLATVDLEPLTPLEFNLDAVSQAPIKQVVNSQPEATASISEDKLEFSLTLEPLDQQTIEKEQSSLKEQLFVADQGFDLAIQFDQPANKNVETVNLEPTPGTVEPAAPIRESTDLVEQIKPKEDTQQIALRQSPIIDAEPAPQPPLIKCARISHNHSLLSEILIPVLIGVTILAALNWLYFNSKKSGPSYPEQHYLQKIQLQDSAQQNAPVVTKNRTSAIQQPPATWQISGKTKTDQLEIDFNFVVIPEQQLLLSLDVTTTEPQPLSPEDIVNNRKRAPWIYSIPIKNWRLVLDANGNFSAEMPARVYIERWEKRERVLALAKVSGKYQQQNKQISAILTVSHSIESESDRPDRLIDRLESADDYLIWLEAGLEGKAN